MTPLTPDRGTETPVRAARSGRRGARLRHRPARSAAPPVVSAARLAIGAVSIVVAAAPLIIGASLWAEAAGARAIPPGDERLVRELESLGLAPALEALLEEMDAAQRVRLAPDVQVALARIALRFDLSGARGERVDALLAEHDRAVEAAEDDATRARRAAARLHDGVWEGLVGEGLLARVLVGLPVPEETARFRVLCDRVVPWSDAAEIALERRLREIESMHAGRVPAEWRDEARVLAEEIRDALLPTARAAAGAAVTDAELERAAARGSARTADLARLLLSDRLRQRGDAARAAQVLRRILEAPDAAPLERLTARLLMALMPVADQGMPTGTVPEAQAGIFDRMLSAEAAVRRAVEARGSATAPDVIAAMQAMIRVADHEPVVRRHALRLSVARRLGMLVPADAADAQRLPDLARFGAGLHRSMSADPQERQGGRALLESVLEGPGLASQERMDAHTRVAAALSADGRPGEGVERLLAFAEAPGTGPLSGPAAHAAARLALAWEAHADVAQPVTAAQVERALRRAAEHSGAEDDRARFTLALAAHLLRQDRPAEAAESLASVDPRGPHAVERARLATDALLRRRAGGEPVAAAVALDEVRRALDAVRDRAGADAAAVRRRLAVQEAALLLEYEGARSALRALDAIEDAAADPAILADLMQVRIRAHAESGDTDAARRDLALLLERAPAQAEALVVDLLDAALRAVREAEDEGDRERAERVAARELRPLAEVLSARRASRAGAAPQGPASGRAASIALAEALLVLDRAAEALPILDALLAEQPDAARLIAGRAEALFRIGDRDAEAMPLYRRLAAGGSAVEPAYYWLANLRLLEIVARQGRGVDQIGPRIRRLRLADPDLGGPRFRGAFERLEARFGGG